VITEKKHLVDGQPDAEEEGTLLVIIVNGVFGIKINIGIKHFQMF
jgi:hypothetical protein